MAILLRCFITLLVAAFFFVFFLAAFAKVYDADNQQIDAVILGFLSALAWGVAVLAGSTWNGVFNFFAALLAALSLGYVTPTLSICGESGRAAQVLPQQVPANRTAAILCALSNHLRSP